MSKRHEKFVKQIERFLLHEHKEDAQALCAYVYHWPMSSKPHQVIYSLQSAKGIVCGRFFMRNKWNPFFKSWLFESHQYLSSKHIAPSDLLEGLGFNEETILKVPERRLPKSMKDAETRLLYFRKGEMEKLVADAVVNSSYKDKFAGQFEV